MLNRHQLTITAAASFLTNSTDFALSLVHARKTSEDKEQKSERAQAVPWKLLALAGGSAIAGLVAYMRNVEALVPQWLENAGDDEPNSLAPSETAEDSDDGESLLDKVVTWFKAIPESKTSAEVQVTMPKAPALVSTNSGQTLIGSSSSSVDVHGQAASYVRIAAKTIGIDPQLAFSVAKIESNLNVKAKNSVTGATGLNQITPSTWKFLITKYPNLGFTEKDINDPQKNAIMGAVYLKQISQTLKKGLSREPSATEVYLGHFLGPSGALKFLQGLRRNPSAIASEMFPAAVKANPTIFFDQKVPRTLGQIFDLMNAKVTKARESYTTVTQTVEAAPSVASGPYGSSATSSTPQAAPLVSPQASSGAPNTSIFLSAKVVARRPPESTRLPEPALETQTSSVTTSSIPATQAKTYARTRQGNLVSFSAP
jgi:hypothetical protein